MPTVEIKTQIKVEVGTDVLVADKEGGTCTLATIRLFSANYEAFKDQAGTWYRLSWIQDVLR